MGIIGQLQHRSAYAGEHQPDLFQCLPVDIFGVPAWNFAQFLSPYFGLAIGKFATITNTSGDMNEFAHGKGATQFMNMAFNFNPLLVFTVPYSTLGVGVVVLPTKDPKEAIVTLLVLSANGLPTTSGFERFERQRHSGCRRGPGQNGLFRSHRAPAFRYDFFQQEVHFD